jgi:translation initiation factor 2 alpha subunit (eIF-2alpha)
MLLKTIGLKYLNNKTMSNKKETTLEEFAEKLARAFDNDNYKALMDLVIDGAKWQAERMYSEEDMIAIVEKSRETGLTAEFLLLTEQFKKK